MHTKDDIKYIENMKNNKIDIMDNPIYMCALNKDVDEINKVILIRMKMNHLNFKNLLNIIHILKMMYQKLKLY